LNLLQVKDALEETTMVKDVAPQRTLVMKAKVTVMAPEMAVPMTVMLDARETSYAAPTTVSSLAPTSIPRMTAVRDPAMVESSVHQLEALVQDSRSLVGAHGAHGHPVAMSAAMVRRLGRGTVWADSVELRFSTSLKIKRLFARENATISSHKVFMIFNTVSYCVNNIYV